MNRNPKVLRHLNIHISKSIRIQTQHGGEVVLEAGDKHWPAIKMRRETMFGTSEIHTCGLGSKFLQSVFIWDHSKTH